MNKCLGLAVHIEDVLHKYAEQNPVANSMFITGRDKGIRIYVPFTAEHFELLLSVLKTAEDDQADAERGNGGGGSRKREFIIGLH